MFDIDFHFISPILFCVAYIGKRATELRFKIAKQTDHRIRIMNEIIQGIQVIKMYAWEHSFGALVDKIRK